MTIDASEKYCTHEKYSFNQDPTHFDDTSNTDEWQNEVYAIGCSEFMRAGYRRIADVGCGSGFKLVKYFPPHCTIGLEVDPALSYVKMRYPNREWRDAHHLSSGLQGADMVICSDVIEHLADPSSLLDSFAKCSAELFVISTPALEIIAEIGWSPRLGPPGNPSHIREWTTVEFVNFVSRYLKVISHQVTSVAQGTQMIIARKI